MACTPGKSSEPSLLQLLLQLPIVAAADCMHDMAMQLKQLEEEAVLRAPGAQQRRHGRRGGDDKDDRHDDSASDPGDGAYLLMHRLTGHC